jgi:hypothetical protein
MHTQFTGFIIAVSMSGIMKEHKVPIYTPLRDPNPHDVR